MIRVEGVVDQIEETLYSDESVAYRNVNVRFQESEGSTTFGCEFVSEEDYAIGDSVPVFYEPGKPEWALAEPDFYPYNGVAALGCGTVAAFLGGWLVSRIF